MGDEEYDLKRFDETNNKYGFCQIGIPSQSLVIDEKLLLTMAGVSVSGRKGVTRVTKFHMTFWCLLWMNTKVVWVCVGLNRNVKVPFICVVPF